MCTAKNVAVGTDALYERNASSVLRQRSALERGWRVMLMDRTYIDANHVVARYLADQLTDDERLAFEEYFVTKPEVVREIEAAARLKVGLASLQAKGELAPLMKPAANAPRYLAMAASLLVAVGATFWFGRGFFEAPALVTSVSALKDTNGNPLSIFSRWEIVRLRSTSYDAEIELPATPQAIELKVLPEYPAEPPRYRISLARIADDSLTPVATVDGLTLDDREFAKVYVDSSRLSPGDYQLTISGDAGTTSANQVSTFRIQMLAPPVPPAP